MTNDKFTQDFARRMQRISEAARILEEERITHQAAEVYFTAGNFEKAREMFSQLGKNYREALAHSTEEAILANAKNLYTCEQRIRYCNETLAALKRFEEEEQDD